MSSIWNGFRDVAVIVAIITTIGLLGQAFLKPNNEPCRIATEFLMDDMKDGIIVDAETAAELRSIYVTMAKQHCGEE